jgi:mono/diheme cytochrome c family protein
VFSVVIAGSAQRAQSPASPASQSAPARPAAKPKPATPDAGFESVVKPFLAQNCISCHGNKKQENDLNLQTFESRQSLIDHRDQWDEVIGRLRRGEMPPLEAEEQPSDEERQAVAAWLGRELERIDATTPSSSASTSSRPTICRRTTRGTVSTTSPTCSRSRRC